jgi:hypothetical protein
MKSLQDKYNLIKEGKGNKELFLKEARTMFPNVVTNVLTFDQAIHNLSERGIISETLVFGGIAQNKTPDWFKIFNENVKAELKETDREVEEMETKGYDYKDTKNNNNISTAEILTGYYAEMKDPKNADKTETEIKAIVFKNLEKDPLHYVKTGQFGVKDLGYTDEAPGLGKPKEVTGKYKSSGMEPVKLSESKHSNEADLKIYKSELNLINKVKAKGEKHEKRKAELEKKIADLESKMNEGMYGSSDGDYDADQESRAKAEMYYDKGMQAYSEGDYLKADQYYKLALKNGSWLGWTEQDLPPYGDESLQETLTEAKRKAVEKHLKEIEKLGEVASVAHKIEKINEKIEELKNKLTMTEGDDVKEMVDKKAVNELKKDIKLYEKKKAFYEKMHSKLSNKAGVSNMEEEAPIMEEEEKQTTPQRDPETDRVFKAMERGVTTKLRPWSEIVKDLLKDKVPGTGKQ